MLLEYYQEYQNAACVRNSFHVRYAESELQLEPGLQPRHHDFEAEMTE